MLPLCCRVDMTAGSDLVFDHLSHNHIEPRAEYQFFGDVLLVHRDLSLDERLFVCSWRDSWWRGSFCGLYPPIEAMIFASNCAPKFISHKTSVKIR